MASASAEWARGDKTTEPPYAARSHGVAIGICPRHPWPVVQGPGHARALGRHRPAASNRGRGAPPQGGGINLRASRGLGMPAACRGDAGGRRRGGAHGSATGPARGGAAGGGAAVCASQQQAHAPILAGAQVHKTSQEPPCSRPPARPPTTVLWLIAQSARALASIGLRVHHAALFALCIGNGPKRAQAPLPLALSMSPISQSSEGGVRSL